MPFDGDIDIKDIGVYAKKISELRGYADAAELRVTAALWSISEWAKDQGWNEDQLSLVEYVENLIQLNKNDGLTIHANMLDEVRRWLGRSFGENLGLDDHPVIELIRSTLEYVELSDQVNALVGSAIEDGMPLSEVVDAAGFHLVSHRDNASTDDHIDLHPSLYKWDAVAVTDETVRAISTDHSDLTSFDDDRSTYLRRYVFEAIHLIESVAETSYKAARDLVGFDNELFVLDRKPVREELNLQDRHLVNDHHGVESAIGLSDLMVPRANPGAISLVSIEDKNYKAASKSHSDPVFVADSSRIDLLGTHADDVFLSDEGVLHVTHPSVSGVSLGDSYSLRPESFAVDTAALSDDMWWMYLHARSFHDTLSYRHVTEIKWTKSLIEPVTFKCTVSWSIPNKQMYHTLPIQDPVSLHPDKQTSDDILPSEVLNFVFDSVHSDPVTATDVAARHARVPRFEHVSLGDAAARYLLNVVNDNLPIDDDHEVSISDLSVMADSKNIQDPILFGHVFDKRSKHEWIDQERIRDEQWSHTFASHFDSAALIDAVGSHVLNIINDNLLIDDDHEISVSDLSVFAGRKNISDFLRFLHTHDSYSKHALIEHDRVTDEQRAHTYAPHFNRATLLDAVGSHIKSSINDFLPIDDDHVVSIDDFSEFKGQKGVRDLLIVAAYIEWHTASVRHDTFSFDDDLWSFVYQGTHETAELIDSVGRYVLSNINDTLPVNDDHIVSFVDSLMVGQSKSFVDDLPFADSHASHSMPDRSSAVCVTDDHYRFTNNSEHDPLPISSRVASYLRDHVSTHLGFDSSVGSHVKQISRSKLPFGHDIFQYWMLLSQLYTEMGLGDVLSSHSSHEEHDTPVLDDIIARYDRRIHGPDVVPISDQAVLHPDNRVATGMGFGHRVHTIPLIDHFIYDLLKFGGGVGFDRSHMGEYIFNFIEDAAHTTSRIVSDELGLSCDFQLIAGNGVSDPLGLGDYFMAMPLLRHSIETTLPFSHQLSLHQGADTTSDLTGFKNEASKHSSFNGSDSISFSDQAIFSAGVDSVDSVNLHNRVFPMNLVCLDLYSEVSFLHEFAYARLPLIRQVPRIYDRSQFHDAVGKNSTLPVNIEPVALGDVSDCHARRSIMDPLSLKEDIAITRFVRRTFEDGFSFSHHTKPSNRMFGITDSFSVTDSLSLHGKPSLSVDGISFSEEVLTKLFPTLIKLRLEINTTMGFDHRVAYEIAARGVTHELNALDEMLFEMKSRVEAAIGESSELGFSSELSGSSSISEKDAVAFYQDIASQFTGLSLDDVAVSDAVNAVRRRFGESDDGFSFSDLSYRLILKAIDDAIDFVSTTIIDSSASSPVALLVDLRHSIGSFLDSNKSDYLVFDERVREILVHRIEVRDRLTLNSLVTKDFASSTMDQLNTVISMGIALGAGVSESIFLKDRFFNNSWYVRELLDLLDAGAVSFAPGGLDDDFGLSEDLLIVRGRDIKMNPVDVLDLASFEGSFSNSDSFSVLDKAHVMMVSGGGSADTQPLVDEACFSLSGSAEDAISMSDSVVARRVRTVTIDTRLSVPDRVRTESDSDSMDVGGSLMNEARFNERMFNV
ncbi:MAG: hypothetical protein HOD58_12210 [Gammaproteobacteria bacterium]|nr:hypothetical protein [Gammaproteobacteria bacterium]